MPARDLSALTTHSIETGYNHHPETVLYADFDTRLVTGEYSYVTSKTWFLGAVTDKDFDFPAELTVDRLVDVPIKTLAVLTSDDAAVMFEHRYTESVSVVVASNSREVAQRMIESFSERIPRPKKLRGTVDTTVWYDTGLGSRRAARSIEALKWKDITHNYPQPVRDPLNDLHRVTRPAGAGKLILWHGAPGTGKTTAIRSLMRSWSKWCEPHYVADPERLFASTEYLLNVAQSPTEKKRWRLVIAEDTDEFLRVSARRESGAALGRLLNFTDGIIGQGSNTLILLTTNEQLDKLHPAVTRPGRCLAQIEFTKFTPSEGALWLGSDYAHPSEPKTLAELLQIKGEARQISNGIEEAEAAGTYL